MTLKYTSCKLTMNCIYYVKWHSRRTDTTTPCCDDLHRSISLILWRRGVARIFVTSLPLSVNTADSTSFPSLSGSRTISSPRVASIAQCLLITEIRQQRSCATQRQADRRLNRHGETRGAVAIQLCHARKKPRDCQYWLNTARGRAQP